MVNTFYKAVQFNIIICTVIFNSYIYADVLVRVEVQHGVADSDFFDIRLFDEVAPDTVNNFLNYAINANGHTTTNGGSYKDVFFHRNSAGFVIQAGGFLYNPDNGGFDYDEQSQTFSGGLGGVIDDPTVNNEFQLSNKAGTLAMAKRSPVYLNTLGESCFPEGVDCVLLPGTGADSATSQWFINILDNSFLDTQNGGFTVFAKVMGNGMELVNTFAATPGFDKTDIHPDFGSLPLVNYSTGEISKDHLLKITSISELVNITGNIDFNLQLTSTLNQRTVTVQNRSEMVIAVDAIKLNSSVPSFFSIKEEGCSGVVLSIGSSCSFVLEFSPDIDGDFTDSIDIDIPSISVSYPLLITGRSASIIKPEISPNFAELDFGEVGLVTNGTVLPTQMVLIINNEGNADLEISSVLLSGEISLFEIFDNCTSFSPIAPGDFCVLPVNLYPTVEGEKSASLTIVSNDLDQPSLVIPVQASVVEDTDGVESEIEFQSSLFGDGNFDGVIDGNQSNVTSFKSDNNQNVTLVTDSFVEFSKVTIDAVTMTNLSLENVNFEFGSLSFEAKNNVSTGVFNIGFILPVGTNMDAVYLYGQTVDDTKEHWYRFDFDGKTGARPSAAGQFTTQDGSTVEREIVLLSFKDGGRGDNDMMENGKIEVFSAISISPPKSSGSLHILLMLIMLIMIVFSRKYIDVKYK